MHVAIDVLPTRASKANQKKIMRVVYIVIILFSITALVIGGFRLVYISYLLGQSSPALQIPLAFVYMVIPISGILIIYYKVSDLLKK
jgi:TRAP-type C4-dicarboxylate transport system permease small subunit